MLRDVIVIGAPRGGAAVLVELLHQFPADLPAAIFIVLHACPAQPILLADALNAPGRIRAAQAVDGERVEQRRIYVSGNGRHLAVDHDTVRVTDEPECNGFRPSIDVLFQSAARTCRDRVVAVALLHLQNEGSSGLNEVRHHRGRVITHRNVHMSHPPTDQIGEPLSDYHVALNEMGSCIVECVRGDNGG